MRKYLFYIILFTTLFSCSKEILIDIPGYNPEVVVDGWISTDDFANIILTKSSPFLDDYDSASIRSTFLNYAKVTLTSSSGESEILTLYKRNEFFPPFVFRSVKMKGVEGESYSIRIEVEGKNIIAESTLTKNPIVDNISVISTSDTTRQFEVYIDDDPSTDNYYYVEIKVEGQDSNFHAAEFPLFTDDGKNGKVNVLRVYRSNQPDPLSLFEPDVKRHLPKYEFHSDDPVFIKVSSIDRIAYEVLNELYVDQINSGNPFSFVNNETSTNIDGGIGRWTGMASEVLYVK